MKAKLRSCVVTAMIALIYTSPAHGQDKKPCLTFDVASIKLSSSDGHNAGMRTVPDGRGYSAQSVSVQEAVSLIYRIPMDHIKGAPDWVHTDRYDVEARADHSCSQDDLRVMFQNLLADRFNLKLHKEIKEGRVYALMVDTPGSKMKIDDDPRDPKIPMMTPGRDNVAVATKISMPYLSWWLGQQLLDSDRPVIDKTGLDKYYDFTLSFAPELPVDASKEGLPLGLRDRPSLSDALKEQLGLKLRAQKGPVEYYVIDHIDKPSKN